MSKWQQSLLALACLVISYIAGVGLPLLVKQIGRDLQNSPQVASSTVNASLGPMLDFSLQDEFGRERTFSEAHSGRPAFVYFFSGGCSHCFNMLQKMGPVIARAQERGFRVIGIEYYGTPDQGQQFRQKYNLPTPILADPKGEVCGRFGVGEFTAFLVGADNNLYFRSLMNGS